MVRNSWLSIFHLLLLVASCKASGVSDELLCGIDIINRHAMLKASHPSNFAGRGNPHRAHSSIKRAYHERAVAASRSRVATRTVVTILGFASDLTLAVPSNRAGSASRYQRFTGHVGFSFDGGKTIFGFGPAIPETIDHRAGLARLARGATFPGRVTDDTALFHAVYDNPHHPDSNANAPQIVYRQDIAVSAGHFRGIKSVHDARPIDQAMPAIPYGFPFPDTEAFNCATYPASLGIELPHFSGKLATYIATLAEVGEPWRPTLN